MIILIILFYFSLLSTVFILLETWFPWLYCKSKRALACFIIHQHVQHSTGCPRHSVKSCWILEISSNLPSGNQQQLLDEAFQEGLVVKNPPENAGDARDKGLVPGSGRSLEEEMATHSSILAGRTPWIEVPDRLHSSYGHKESNTTEAT